MPGVKITLSSIATNVRFTTETDSSGVYQFPQLPPATYSLIAEASGFKKASIADVLVQVDQITHVDVGLEIWQSDGCCGGIRRYAVAGSG